MGFADLIKRSAEKSVQNNSKKQPVKKTRTVTKKPPSKTSITGNAIDTFKNHKRTTLAPSKITAAKDAANKALTSKTDKLTESFKTAAEGTIRGGFDYVLQSQRLASASNSANDLLLKTTVSALISAGANPLYNNGYCIKAFIKNDYVDTIKHIVEKGGYSVCNGKTSQYFNAIKYGSTKCSLYILEEKARIKGISWYQQNRCAEIKEIILNCWKNFIPEDILKVINLGFNKAPEKATIIYDADAPDVQKRHFKRKVLPSTYGDNGCDEFGIKFKFTRSEINKIFPEKKSKSGAFWITYPKTQEHHELFLALTSKIIYGGDRLDHEIVNKRLFQNMVYTPLTKDMVDFADEFAKETGLDKLLNAIENKDALLYQYVRWMEGQGYL